MGLILVTHRGAAAALCSPTRVLLLDPFDVLDESDPGRAHVLAKCWVAGAILQGHVPGPYDDRLATTAAIELRDRG